MTLPTYEQAADDVRENTKPSALAWFICEHEPSNVICEAKFRRELTEVIREAEEGAALREHAHAEERIMSVTIEMLRDEQFRIEELKAEGSNFAIGLGIVLGVAISVVTFIFGVIVFWMLS